MQATENLRKLHLRTELDLRRHEAARRGCSSYRTITRDSRLAAVPGVGAQNKVRPTELGVVQATGRRPPANDKHGVVSVTP